MRSLALLICASALFAAQPVRDGNFDIRCDTDAKIQTNVEIPFTIHVKDNLQKPVRDAKVMMRIYMADNSHEAVFKAPAIDIGVYVAKPVFPIPGNWNAEVKVTRSDQETARILQYNVAE